MCTLSLSEGHNTHMVRDQDLKEIILENSEYISEIEEIQPRVNITLPNDQTRKVVVLYGIRRCLDSQGLETIYKPRGRFIRPAWENAGFYSRSHRWSQHRMTRQPRWLHPQQRRKEEVFFLFFSV